VLAAPATATIPSEVLRVLAQSKECLSWNAALALYTLGVDFTAACKEGFVASLAKWRRRKEQAKILIAADLVERAKAVLGERS